MPHPSRIITLLVVGLWFCPVFGQEAINITSASGEIQTILGLIREKKWQEALERVEPLAKASPDSEQVLLFQVAIFQGMGRHEECQQKAQIFLSKYPSSTTRDQVLYLSATSLYQSGKKQEAISQIETVDQSTKDPTLKKNSAFLLTRWRAEVNRIGFRLGGTPPTTPEDKERIKQAGLRILKMALEDYFRVNGQYPAQLQALLEGTPPYLRTLPEDPTNPGKTYEYIQEGEGYRFPAE